MSVRQPGNFVRTNYRRRGRQGLAGVPMGALQSQIVILGQSHSGNNFLTFSMQGYGAPEKVLFAHMSGGSTVLEADIEHHVMVTQSFSGSMVFVFPYASNVIATGTTKVHIGVLIASRPT